MARVLFMAAASGVLAMCMPTCVPPAVLPTGRGQARIAELWEQPLTTYGRGISSTVHGAPSGHPIPRRPTRSSKQSAAASTRA